MQFKEGVFAALTTFVVSVTASAVPVVKGDCSAPNHPCNTFSGYPTCSPEWNTLIDKLSISNLDYISRNF